MRIYRLLLAFLLLFSTVAEAAGTQRRLAADLVEGVQTEKDFLNGLGSFESPKFFVTGKWVNFADAAGSSPVDGIGGSPTTTCTRTTSSPLAGEASLLITKDAANRQGEGCSIPFSIDTKDQGNPVNIKLTHITGSGTYADGDVKVFVYDVTNGSIITPSFNSIKNVTSSRVRPVIEFTAASNSTSYRLIFHVNSTSASAYTLKVDNVQVGPAPLALRTQGQSESSSVATTLLQAPNNQLTTTGDGQRLLETGNQNLLINPSFENSTFDSGWTATGSFLATPASAAFDGKQALASYPSGGIIASQSTSAVIHGTSVNYEFSGWINYGGATPPTVQVCALYAGVESQCSGNYVINGGWQQVLLNLPSNTSGTTGIEFKCTANCPASGSAIVLDAAYMGPARNIAQVARAYRFGSASWAPIANCLWGGPSSSYANFTADTDCNTPTVTENATAPGTKIPGLVFASMPPGTYSLRAFGTFLSPAVQNACFRFSDGTNTTRGTCIYIGSVASTNAVTSVVEGSWTLTAPMTNVTIQLQGLSSSSNPSIDGRPTPTSDGLFIDVFYTPLQNQQAVAADQTNVGLQSSASSLTATTTAPTKGTTTKDVFQWRLDGEHMIWSWDYIQTAAGSAGSGTYLLTLPNNYTIDSSKAYIDTVKGSVLGHGRVSNSSANLSSAWQMEAYAYSSTQIAFRYQSAATDQTVMGSANITFANTNFNINIDGRIPITGRVENQKAPTLTGSVTSNYTNALRTEEVNFGGASQWSNCTSSPCTAYYSTGALSGNVTRSGTGVYVIPWNSGTWSVPPRCSIQAVNAGFNAICNATGTVTGGNMTVNCGQPGVSAADSGVSISCTGPR